MRVRRSASGTSLDASDTRLLIEERLPHVSNPRYRRKHRSKRAQLVFAFLILLTVGSFYILVSKLGQLKIYEDTSYNASPLSELQILADGSSVYKIGVVTDLDHDSKDDLGKEWKSYFKTGLLTVSADRKKISVDWDDKADVVLKTNIAAGDRAMELSDLVVFDHKLLSIDDRTGLIYEIFNKSVIPWIFLNDGPGRETKPIKGEWMTVKDQELYIGGLGKEWSSSAGIFINDHPMWVKIVDRYGRVKHTNWRENYIKIRDAVGLKPPGYMIHESVQWSPVHKQWFLLPRRASKLIYNDDADEQRGTNMLIAASEDFVGLLDRCEDINFTRVGNGVYEGSKGFSAFQFIPNTNDELIIALKSEEINGKPVASHVTVFDINGNVLLEDQTLTGKYKFEGLAII